MSKPFTKYEQTWIDGLNRGDLSAADGVFAPDCVIHMAGSPTPNLSLSGFKQMIAGLLAAFPDIRLTIGDRVVERWEQWDQAGMLRQLGLLG